MNRAHIGERLRQVRLQRGKSQNDLAYESGVSVRTIVRYESGDIKKMDLLAALAQALGTSLEALMAPPKKLRGSDSNRQPTGIKPIPELSPSYSTSSPVEPIEDEAA